MTEKSLLKEVFTRLQKIFPDDVYISDRTYVIAGKQSKDEIPGTPICKLEKKYIDELLPYGECGYLYIDNLTLAKDDPEHHITKIKDSEKIEELDKIFSNIYTKIIDASTNSKLVSNNYDEYIKFIKQLFESKKMVKIKFKDEDILTIGLSMLPLLTEKNANGMAVVNISINDMISRIIFKYTTTSFYVWYGFTYIVGAIMNVDDDDESVGFLM